MDPFLSDVQGLANAKRADRMLANIQQKVSDVFRPLAVLWAAIEQGRTVHELTELVQMAIVMMGDASNVLSETRRQRLMAALPKRCPKSLLQGLHPSGDLLFGDGFSREYKRKCQEMDVFQPRPSGRRPGTAQDRSQPTSPDHFSGRSRYRSDPVLFCPYDRAVRGHVTRRPEKHFRQPAKNGRGQPFRGRPRGR